MIKSEKGFSLIEVTLAIALLGIIGAALFGALATSHKVLFIADEKATAESLAREQMEYIKSQLYSDDLWSYQVTFSNRTPLEGTPSWWDPDEDNPPLLSSDYAGYLVEARAEPIDADRDGEVEVGDEEVLGDDEGLLKITVEIHHPEDEEEPLVTLEGYKGDW